MEEGTSSGSRRTRSQVAPDWTLKDCLILVNEIAAVESDCSNALSSFQKWTMISDNCNALDVHRTFNQCRRKWDSMFSDYSQINKWESKGRHSYWSLSSEKRRKLNLPGNVDNELFQAINAVVMIQENKEGSEPDSDSDPEEKEDFDVVDVTPELAFAGSKRSRQRTMTVVKENLPHKRKIGEEPRRNRGVRENIQEKGSKANHQKKTMEEKKPSINAVVMIQENRDGSEPDSDSDPEAQEDFDVVDVTAQLGSKRSRQRTMAAMKENPLHKRKTGEEPRRNRGVRENIQEQGAKATHLKKTMEEKKPVVEISTDEEEEEETMSTEEEVKALEAKLGEKADMIHDIVGRNLAKESETGDDVGINDKLKFVRQQGDELIVCLSEIANTLNRLREVSQEN